MKKITMFMTMLTIMIIGFVGVSADTLFDTIVPSSITYNSSSYDWTESVFGLYGLNVDDINVSMYCDNISDEDNAVLEFYYKYGTYTQSYVLDCIDYTDLNNFASVPLTALDVSYVKRILFDRDIDEDNYIGYRVGNSSSTTNEYTYMTIGMSFEFITKSEFKFDSLLVSYGIIEDVYSNFRNVSYVNILDSTETIYAQLLNNTVGTYQYYTNTYSIPTEYKQAYGVEFLVINDYESDSYNIEIDFQYTEFQIFSTDVFDTLPISGLDLDDQYLIDKPEYEICTSTDLFCKGKNVVVWVFIDFPPIAILYSGITSMVNLFYSLLVSMLSLFGISISGSALVYEYTGVIGFMTGAVAIIILFAFIKKVGGVIK